MKTIENKILAYILLPIITLGLSYFLVANYQLKRAYDHHSEEEAITDAARLADLSKDAILNKDSMKLTQIIFDEKKYGNHINYIAVFDDQGKILAHTLVGASPAFEEPLDTAISETKTGRINFSETTIFNVDQPVFIGLYKIGFVRTGYDFEESEKEFLFVIYLYAFLGIIALALLYFFGRRLSKFIIGPIEELTKIMSEFSKGEREKRAKIPTNDEIGKLSLVFNQMADNLKEYEEFLQDKKEKLEKRLNELEMTKKAMLNLLEDSKELSLSIKEERDKFRTMIDSLGEGVVLVGQNFEILAINKKAESLLEAPANHYIGQNYYQVIPRYIGEEKVKEENRPLNKIIGEQTSYRIAMSDNNYCQSYSGRKFPIALIASPIATKNLKGAIIVFRDITEEKKLDEAKGGFISLASHQMRTPLTTIRWYTEILKSGDLGKLNKEQSNFIDQIYDSTLKILETIKLLLSISRLQSGQITNNPVETNLKEFALKIVAGLKPSIGSKSVKVSITDETPSVKIDQTILEQVLSNLINNAITYTDEKGNIEVEFKSDRSRVICSVKDDGIGIPTEETNKIFGHFYRAPNAKSKKPDGNGLGLNLAKDLVKIWNGQIWFESPALWPLKKGEARHKGTVFYFTIPLNPHFEQIPAAETAEAEQTAVAHNN